ALNEMRGVLATADTSTFNADVLAKLHDILEQNSDNEFDLSKLAPEVRATLDEYIKNIETVLNREDAPSVVEEYLRGGLDRVDGISESAVGVITSLSDDLIERGLKTVENIKAVPGAISQRAKEAIDRRIV